jgi:hypothetical protein
VALDHFSAEGSLRRRLNARQEQKQQWQNAKLSSHTIVFSLFLKTLFNVFPTSLLSA